MVIPLYEVKKPVELPDWAHSKHWKLACWDLGGELREFLGCEDVVEVTPVARCSAAVQLAAEHLLRRYPTAEFLVDYRPYRTVPEAITMAGGRWRVGSELEMRGHRQSRSPTIPVYDTITGTKPHLGRPGPWIYDCAHTAYPEMMRGWLPTDEMFVCLSFYPTKPLGGFGGGAIIHSKSVDFESRAYPCYERPSIYAAMQTAQCAAVEYRIRTWDPAWWARRAARYGFVRQTIRDRFQVAATYHGDEDPVTPHLLSFIGPQAVLRRVAAWAQKHNLETGHQFYPAGTFSARSQDIPLTIPFHDPRIQEWAARD